MLFPKLSPNPKYTLGSVTILNMYLCFSRYTVQNVFKVSDSTNWDVSALANSEVRIIILYCTQSEAALILEQAAKAGNHDTLNLGFLTF